MTTRRLAILLISVLLAAIPAISDVPARYQEGLTHGFLVLSTLDGTPLAQGDLLEVAHGHQVTSRLIFHFKDGSLQEESTVFSQRHRFSLISYRLVQKGPTFPHPTDMSIVTSTGEVTVRYTDDKGEEKVESEHLKLPPDLANGLVVTLLKNLRPGESLPPLPMVVATPKPRIVKLTVNSQDAERFSLAGSSRESIHYTFKIEIGGIAGLLAPWLGKQPPDANVWIIGGEAPSFVKSETLSYMGGPIWRMELVSPVWPHSADKETNSASAAKP